LNAIREALYNMHGPAMSRHVGTEKPFSPGPATLRLSESETRRSETTKANHLHSHRKTKKTSKKSAKNSSSSSTRRNSFGTFPLPFLPLSSPPPPSQQTLSLPHPSNPLTPSPTSYKIGATFYSIPNAEAQELLTTATGEADTEIEALEDKMGTIREEMDKLKASLYARFGRGINLEA
jgi:hypothetical protein